jgi:glycosyltransferase involved in cell wall biosynthesis
MTISFAVLAYNESARSRCKGERLLRSLSAAREHPGIDEIVVVDDGSSDYEWLQGLLSEVPKVNLYHNEGNLGVFLNKIEVVARSAGDWVIVSDSDNFKDAAHIDKALSQPLDPNVIYCPSFARPVFDYRHLTGEYDLVSISTVDFTSAFARCCFNTGNQFVHRQTFLEVFGQYRNTRYWLDMWRHLPGVPPSDRSSHYWRQVWDANDSMLFNMLWMYAGKRLAVVEGLEYEHYMSKDDSSNYNRSPADKGPLGEALYRELVERSKIAAWNKENQE